MNEFFYILEDEAYMKILLCRWHSICETGIIRALTNMGHEICEFDQPFENTDYDKVYLQGLIEYIKPMSDINVILSVNFMPIVAKVAKVFKLTYLSWVADCPSIQLYSNSVELPNNYIFMFDKIQAEKLRERIYDHAFHLPLAGDTYAMDQIKITQADIEKYSCDVSFVGTLYTEKCDYNNISHLLPKHMEGYCQGLINAQRNVFGYYLLEDAITEEFAQEFKGYTEWSLLPDYYEDTKALVADRFLGIKCSSDDRVATMNALGQYFDTHLWSLSDPADVPNVSFRGGADTGVDMPRIFKCSKINLNISLRTIRSGLPQRIFDIMAAGGFVITNFQPEILDLFVPDEDIVYYESIPDLINKIDYYLAHDEERERIARNGYKKVRKLYSYEARLKEMFEMVGIG